MHVAYAIIFFGLIGLFETVRHGVFGFSPTETNGVIYGALAFAAILLLRGDILYTLYQPRHPLYGDARLNWTWPRTALGILLGPVLWALPIAYGVGLSQLDLTPGMTETLILAALLQMGLVGIAECLFFREAAIKAFAGSRAQIYVISTLAVFVFYFPSGIPQALIAAGGAIYFLTLRMIGTNLIVVAALQGATIVTFGQVLTLGLSGSALWVYAGYFLAASTAVSLVVFSLFSRRQGGHAYA